MRFSGSCRCGPSPRDQTQQHKLIPVCVRAHGLRRQPSRRGREFRPAIGSSRSTIRKLNPSMTPSRRSTTWLPEGKVAVRLVRDDKPDKPIDLATDGHALAEQCADASLPPAFENHATADANRCRTSRRNNRVETTRVPAHLPGLCARLSRRAGQSLGALLWLQSPSDSKPEDIVLQWQKICDRDGLVLIRADAQRCRSLGANRPASTCIACWSAFSLSTRSIRTAWSLAARATRGRLPGRWP